MKKIGKSSRGHSKGVSKILGHLYRGHSFLVIYVFTFTLYRKTSNKPPLSLASIEHAACIRDPASIRSFTGI